MPLRLSLQSHRIKMGSRKVRVQGLIVMDLKSLPGATTFWEMSRSKVTREGGGGILS